MTLAPRTVPVAATDDEGAWLPVTESTDEDPKLPDEAVVTDAPEPVAVAVGLWPDPVGIELVPKIAKGPAAVGAAVPDEPPMAIVLLATRLLLPPTLPPASAGAVVELDGEGAADVVPGGAAEVLPGDAVVVLPAGVVVQVLTITTSSCPFTVLGVSVIVHVSIKLAPELSVIGVVVWNVVCPVKAARP